MDRIDKAAIAKMAEILAEEMAAASSLVESLGHDPQSDAAVMAVAQMAQGPNTDFLRTMASMLNGKALLVSLAKWARWGRPQIFLKHRFAAALMSTSASAETLRSVAPPYPGFLVELPEGLLTIDDPSEGRKVAVTRLLVSSLDVEWGGGPAWAYVGFTASMMTFYRIGVSTEELLPPDLPELYVPDPFDVDMTEADGRTVELTGRLIVNLCLAMSDPARVRTREGTLPRAKPRLAGFGTGMAPSRPAPTRIVTVDAPVRCNLLPAVRAYLAGDRPALEALKPVRGHWKPKLGARLGRNVWVEPYMRMEAGLAGDGRSYQVTGGSGHGQRTDQDRG